MSVPVWAFPLLVGFAAACHCLSPACGRLVSVVAAGGLTALWLLDPGQALAGASALGVILVSAAAEHQSSRLRAAERAGSAVAVENRQCEERLADEMRISRSLVAVASGLQSSFEPERMLQRFTGLVRTLLGADAAATFVSIDARRLFRLVEVSADADHEPAENPATAFPIDGIDGIGVQPFSFSAGERGRFGAFMREELSTTIGYGVPILRGKQLAGLLVVAFRDPDHHLSDSDRSVLAGSAALCATLFESVRLLHELRASNRVKTEFISTVSHELRTPLNAIIGYCDLLRDGTMGEVNADQRDALDRLMRHAVEFAGLIEAILEVDRLEGAYISVNWTECDLDQFFRQLENSVPAYWRKEGVELRFEGEANRFVRTDTEKLKLSLRNVIQNALKFTAAGCVTVRMSVTPGTLMFTVEDTGVGIRPEVKESLFQMFQPGERTNTRSQGGLGLGLYLADRMVKALWGQISIDSVPGEGTVVRIVLPIEEPLSTQTLALGESRV